jgi:hypothetical protein
LPRGSEARIEKIKRKTSISDLCGLQESSTLAEEGQTMSGRVTFGVLCAIGLGAEASAAALTEETLRNGHVVLHLTVRIDSRDAALFDAAVGKLTAACKRIDVVGEGGLSRRSPWCAEKAFRKGNLV